jgi:hypothetical protein
MTRYVVQVTRRPFREVATDYEDAVQIAQAATQLRVHRGQDVVIVDYAPEPIVKPNGQMVIRPEVVWKQTAA